jgi:hypothetical protein
MMGGINLYLYVNANPLSLTDPLGLSSQIGTNLSNTIRNNDALVQKFGKQLTTDAIKDGAGGSLGIACAIEICNQRRPANNDIILECCSRKVVNVAPSLPDPASRGAFASQSGGLLGACIRHATKITQSPGFKQACPGC